MKYLSILFLLMSLFVQARMPVALATSRAGACLAVYTSHWGDTLAAIAARCQVALDELQQVNINMPLTGTFPSGLPVYMPGTVELPSPLAATTEPVQVPVTAVINNVRVVKSGDTLAAIAAQAGVSIGQIMYVNPDIMNPNLIFPSQKFILPTADSPAVGENQWLKNRVEASAQAIEQSGGSYQPASPNEHWVRVDLATQTAHAFEGDQLVRSFLVSTGLSQFPTVTGRFKIWTKMLTDDMRGADYDLKDVPYAMYFYKDYALHGTYWHNNFGVPMSHGCVNLRTEDAAWLYSWVLVGTVVVVY